MHYVPYLEGRFHTASPDSQGVPSGAILQFLTELDRLDVDLHSLYIFRNGFQLLGANRRPYQGDTPRRIYSAAKALTGLAVLFAIQEGLVSLKTRLTQLFPEDLPETVTPRMESITVYHLLTMTTGHDRDTFRPVLNSTNSVRAFLEEPLDFEPGTHFLYNNGVPHILGLIVKKVSGINYLDFLRPRFLEPLGIYCTVEQTQRGELEGSRTMCTAEGFAKLSLFYLQEGNWNGQQLLDARLVRAAVSFQVPTRRCSSISFMHSDQLAGYGFQLWRNAREGARLDGGRSPFGFLGYPLFSHTAPSRPRPWRIRPSQVLSVPLVLRSAHSGTAQLSGRLLRLRLCAGGEPLASAHPLSVPAGGTAPYFPGNGSGILYSSGRSPWGLDRQ